MKRNILIIFIMLISQLTFSQVGIGTTNPSASSALEIRSTNSGLLIPRISLISSTDTTTIASPATSLLVYNLSTSNDVTPGFYYWEGSWKSLKSASSSTTSGWSLSGNTTVATDYLGTNNYNSLVFKVNNTQFSKYHPNGGILIGNLANANDNNSIAIGTSANASLSNEAIAIGKLSTASGFQSMAFGLSSNASTNSAIAIGNNSRATGQQSTALGTNANSSGQNATAIGYNANATQANSIILGSTLDSNSKIGIGTNTPDERLHIAGSIKIVDGSQGVGKVLTSDSNGKAVWASPSTTKSYADIYLGGSTVQSLNQYNNVNFGSINASSNITVNTNNIQVLVTGKYRISYRITFYRGNEDKAFRFNLYKGTTIIPGSLTSTGELDANDSADKALSISGSVIVSLNANEQVGVKCLSPGNNNNTVNLLPNGCSLSVELVD